MTDKKPAAAKKPAAKKKAVAKKKAAADKKKSARNRPARKRPGIGQGQAPLEHKPGMMEKMVILQNTIGTLTSSMSNLSEKVLTDGPYADFNALGMLQESLRIQLIALHNLTAEFYDIEEHYSVKVDKSETPGEGLSISIPSPNSTSPVPEAPVFTPPGETTGGH